MGLLKKRNLLLKKKNLLKRKNPPKRRRKLLHKKKNLLKKRNPLKKKNLLLKKNLLKKRSLLPRKKNQLRRKHKSKHLRKRRRPFLRTSLPRMQRPLIRNKSLFFSFLLSRFLPCHLSPVICEKNCFVVLLYLLGLPPLAIPPPFFSLYCSIQLYTQ